MLVASVEPYTLIFREEAITSRSIMREKETFVVRIVSDIFPGFEGKGEIAIFRGLSAEDTGNFENSLNSVIESVNDIVPEFEELLMAAVNNVDVADIFESITSGHLLIETGYSSINFGLETALANLWNNVLCGGASDIVFDSTFTHGKRFLPINGLVWMGDYRRMTERVERKIDEGFDVLKLKIGGIAFKDELRILENIRSRFPAELLTIRLDANCAFSGMPFEKAMRCLNELSRFVIHSIEQPFATTDIVLTRRAVLENIIPIALDEQLIGITTDEQKRRLLDTVRPHYLILKPSLCGGFAECLRWIRAADDYKIGWWITSALESAIGLSAISQFTAKVTVDGKTMAQGLGTGELYTNDFPSPLKREGRWLEWKNLT